jgi:hypothetical protein
MNAVEIEQAMSDLALQPFDSVQFAFTFGIKDAPIFNGSSFLTRTYLLAHIREKA